MIRIEKMIADNRADCVGCYGCFNACPFSAISMKEDQEGFRYPEVDYEKCRDCGACERACPSLNIGKIYSQEAKKTAEKPRTYAAINEDEAIRKDSSSGGMFHLLAMRCIEQGGIVFGAGFDEEWEVCHQSAETEADLAKLRVSKYLQSRVEDTFSKVQKELKSGRQVLFAGTPCQCAALRQFLKRDYENLFLADFICHGVPSPAVWRKYLALRANKKEIRRISFRNKNLSWERFLLAFFYENANKYLAADLTKDLYLQGFLQNIYLRPSCHTCKFCRANRPTDITLADFWGVKEECPEMYDGKGTSLVFIHSEKGQKVFDEIQAKKKEVSFDKGVKHNPSMIHPSIPSPKREQFFKDFSQSNTDIMQLLHEYTKPTIKERVKGGLRRIPLLVRVVKMTKRVIRG
jgi:coenzyme F420-reducing hydrogenase beta subunit